MKLTLLEIVQLILSDMDSDEVDSISDTPESQQVAKIVQETYIDIASRADLPQHFDFFELEASGDTNLPTVMYKPDDIVTIETVHYDNHDSTDTNSSNPYFVEVPFLNLTDFIRNMFQLNSHDTNVDTHTISGASYLWQTDKFPSYYTTLNDSTLIFDSYNSSFDTTLQKSKSQAYGQMEPGFTMADDFTPVISDKQFSLLIQEAKSQAFTDLKQIGNSKAEQRARKGWLNVQRKASVMPSVWNDSLPDYGRKGRSGPAQIPKNLRNGA